MHLLARLTGPDNGPIEKYGEYFSHWDQKLISASSNIMVVAFKSDGEIEYPGFSANIHFTLLQNKNCESWVDMKNQILQSPNYPNSYGKDIICNHLIAVQPNFHVKLNFLEFDVSFLKKGSQHRTSLNRTISILF